MRGDVLTGDIIEATRTRIERTLAAMCERQRISAHDAAARRMLLAERITRLHDIHRELATLLDPAPMFRARPYPFPPTTTDDDPSRRA